MSATDEDGPLNSAITYSLIGGNQLGHFAIDPKKGELQVAKALDWEQVSHVGGAQAELIKADYSPATGPEYELWSTPHPDTSPDLPSLVFSVEPLWRVRSEAGEGLMTLNLPSGQLLTIGQGSSDHYNNLSFIKLLRCARNFAKCFTFTVPFGP